MHLVCGVGDERAVFENGEVGVRALGDDVSAVQDTFVHAARSRLLRCQNVRQKIERLDVAVEEAGILAADATHGRVGVSNDTRFDHDPKVGLLNIGERMRSDIRRAAQLEVDPKVARIHLAHERIEDLLQLLLGKGRSDLNTICALKKMIEMLVERIDVIVAAVGHVINAVAKIAGAVQHGDGDAVKLIDRSVVISEGFHKIEDPFGGILR